MNCTFKGEICTVLVDSLEVSRQVIFPGEPVAAANSITCVRLLQFIRSLAIDDVLWTRSQTHPAVVDVLDLDHSILVSNEFVSRQQAQTLEALSTTVVVADARLVGFFRGREAKMDAPHVSRDVVAAREHPFATRKRAPEIWRQ